MAGSEICFTNGNAKLRGYWSVFQVTCFENPTHSLLRDVSVLLTKQKLNTSLKKIHMYNQIQYIQHTYEQHLHDTTHTTYNSFSLY